MNFNIYFLMTVGVRVSLHISRLISRGPEVYSRVLILVVPRELELVTIEEQTQA